MTSPLVAHPTDPLRRFFYSAAPVTRFFAAGRARKG